MSFDLRTPWSAQAAESLWIPPMTNAAEATHDRSDHGVATTAALAANAADATAASSDVDGGAPDGWEVSEAVVGRVHRVFRCRPAGSSADIPFAYAIKQVRPEYGLDPITRRLLACEAMVGQLVRSPHLVPVLSARIAGRQPYLVMPWLQGQTLERRLSLGQSFSTAEALWIIRQAACGLNALAEHGFVHNDVKPSNLMVSDDGHVTVLDLGFAARVGLRDRIPKAASVLLGTPTYWAAERTKSADECSTTDHRSDIFSLGLILAELLLSGNPSRDASDGLSPNRAEELARRLRATIGLPRGLIGLVSQMLAQHPWRRPDSFPELIRRLTALEIAAFACRGW